MKIIALCVYMATVACVTGPVEDIGPAHQEVIVGGTTCQPDDPCSCDCPCSPVILDLEGDGLSMTSASTGVVFALEPGRPWPWSWTDASSDDAWLTLPGTNGVIDDGTELFGSTTLQPLTGLRNGFSALAFYDANHDGRLNASDPVFTRLRLWRDSSHDGVSQSTELISLEQSGVHEISLASTKTSITDQYGNQVRLTAPIVADAPVADKAYDVWLVPGAAPTPGPIGGATTNDFVLWHAIATCLSVTPASDANLMYVACQSTSPGGVGTSTVAEEPAGLMYDVPGNGTIWVIKREYDASTETLAIQGARTLCFASAGGVDASGARCAPVTKADGTAWSRVTTSSSIIPSGGGGCGL